jgi:hypothetical protein
MADRRRHPAWAVAFLAVVLVGCAGSPTIVETPAGMMSPSAFEQPSASPIESSAIAIATATPVSPHGPTEPPADSLPTSASVERDGVRIRIDIGSSPLRAGSKTLIRTTVKNTGRTTLRWLVDGCDVDVVAWGELTDAHWRPSAREVPQLLRSYSDWLRAEARLDDPIRLRFDHGWLSGTGVYGCADLGIYRSLKPGASKTTELVWDGQAQTGLGPPPTSPVIVTGMFAGWWRGSEEGEGPRKSMTVTLDTWVVGGPDPSFLSPAEVIDAALADPEFGAWAITQRFNDRRDGVTEYDQAANVWIVGMIHDRDNQRSLLHAALVDPLTGVVIATREHEVR